MSKIQKWSHRFRILFQIILIITPLLVIAFWIAPNTMADLPLKYLGPEYMINFVPGNVYVQQWNWDGFTRFLALLITFIPVGLNMLVLLCLIKLFKLYQQNIIFTSTNVRLLRKVGIFMLIKAALNPIYQVLITLTLTWHNPPGQRVIGIDLEPGFFGNIMLALLIILISWIMLEGSKLHEEQTLTV